MKELFSPVLLPPRAVLIACSSHEDRCSGMVAHLDAWKPAAVAVFHYDDHNPRREENQQRMESSFRAAALDPTVLQFSETDAVRSLRENMERLREIMGRRSDLSVVLDMSVFTKRHLLMMLRWLDDEGLWGRLAVVYTEPEDYDASRYVPLSFGLASFRQIPGFSACPDLSRPVHLVLFLGYEGDRALAAYEHVQPVRATLVIPDPPYKSSWIGRTEAFNADLLAVVGEARTERVDPIDPDATKAALVRIFGGASARGEQAKIICPLGTKPQTLGIYSYLRECADPPAVVYASPLRHNHEFYSYGLGSTWVLKQASKI